MVEVTTRSEPGIIAKVAYWVANGGWWCYSQAATDPTGVFAVNLGFALEVSLGWSKDKATRGQKSFLECPSASGPVQFSHDREEVWLRRHIMDTANNCAMLGYATGVRLSTWDIGIRAASVCGDNGKNSSTVYLIHVGHLVHFVLLVVEKDAQAIDPYVALTYLVHNVESILDRCRHLVVFETVSPLQVPVVIFLQKKLLSWSSNITESHKSLVCGAIDDLAIPHIHQTNFTHLP